MLQECYYNLVIASSHALLLGVRLMQGDESGVDRERDGGQVEVVEEDGQVRVQPARGRHVQHQQPRGHALDGRGRGRREARLRVP